MLIDEIFDQSKTKKDQLLLRRKFNNALKKIAELYLPVETTNAINDILRKAYVEKTNELMLPKKDEPQL